MKLRLICCEVFAREACIAMASSPHVVTPEFTPIASHAESDKLRDLLQRLIDQSDNQGHDALLLGFGLCGNATRGLRAGRTRLVIPRAHDCCTVLLGSRQAFEREFGNSLSAEWSCVGYAERGQSYLHDTAAGQRLGLDKEWQELVAQYGEENAQYVWDTLHPKARQTELIYIQTPETEGLGHLQAVAKAAENQGKPLRVVRGDLRLLRKLLSGEWDGEFLVVPPRHRIEGVYDWSEVMRAVPDETHGGAATA